MKKTKVTDLTRGFITMVLAIAFINYAAAQDETFNIDRSHSVVGFSIKIAGGFSEIEGSFDNFKGSTIVEPGTYNLMSVNVEIQATSINTGVDGRDNHLRTDDFFDVENFPTITFNSVKVTQNGTEYEIEGDFTMHGVTKRLSIPFKRSHEESMIWVFGDPNIIYEGSVVLSRADYGIKASGRWNSIVEASGDLAMSDEVSIRLKFITKGESPTRVLATAVAKGGTDSFNKTWEMLEQKYEGVELFNEDTFGSVARGLRRQKNNEAIVEVYKIWVEKYPDSSKAHFSLGQAYTTIEETKLAKKEFKKALSIDPENKTAEEELAKLN